MERNGNLTATPARVTQADMLSVRVRFAALQKISLFAAVVVFAWQSPAQQPPATPQGLVVQQPSPTDPAVHEKLGLPKPANPKLPTLFLVGDSTVRNGHGDGAGGQWGWGDTLADLFDTSKINVVNRAIGGRSSRTYITEGHWQDTMALMKSGDIVLFQFGHNDSGPLDDTSRARGSIPGIGDEVREIENPILKRHEVVHSYGWYMRQYVVETKAKGATPVLCSPIPRKIWKDGKVVRNEENYGGWARQIAVQQHVAFVDLDEIIAHHYDALGEAKVEPLFADPHTHTSRSGAELNSECVISGLKGLPNDPLAAYLSLKAANIKPWAGQGSAGVAQKPSSDHDFTSKTPQKKQGKA